MLENYEDILKKFRDRVIKQSRKNLTSLKKNASKSLYKSLDSSQQKNGNGYSVTFEMLEYGAFQDLGVSGKKKKYNTPFSYKDKMPPASKLDKWTIRRGIAPRDAKGKFIPRKSVNYLIARSIYIKGIKPSLFFTKPFEKAWSELPTELLEGLLKDTEIILKDKLENLRKI